MVEQICVVLGTDFHIMYSSAILPQVLSFHPLLSFLSIRVTLEVILILQPKLFVLY
jgi:hypothetical protein